ncbi:D-tyrosyl-tRNA(Tyr) deacylase [bacterium]|nr:D-tyrosyl-tRNA(Tyr) deacylase [bacterium]
MRAVVQRVDNASVVVNGKEVAAIGKGVLVLLGIHKDDSEKDAQYIVEKIVNLRIFENEEGKMNLSLLDIGGEVLLVSQFTLLASTKRGRRPDFTQAAPHDLAKTLFSYSASLFERYAQTKTGIFGEKMLVSLTNNGPVTLIIDSREKL